VCFKNSPALVPQPRFKTAGKLPQRVYHPLLDAPARVSRLPRLPSLENTHALSHARLRGQHPPYGHPLYATPSAARTC